MKQKYIFALCMLDIGDDWLDYIYRKFHVKFSLYNFSMQLYTM